MAHLIYLICQICQICQRVESVRESESVRPNLRVRSVRPICEAVGGRSVRPWESDRTLAGEAMRLAVKSVRRAWGSYCLARSPIGLAHGLTDRPPTASQIGLTDRTLWQITWLYGERPCSDSHGLTLQTPTASQIGLTDLRVRSVRPICEAMGVRSPIGLYWVRQCV